MSKKGKSRVFTVNVAGQSYNVTVVEGANAQIDIKEIISAESGFVIQTDSSQPSFEGTEHILSQVPGKVWKVLKKAGDRVLEHEKIIIIESMKMEIDIVSPRDGVIVHINVKEGQDIDTEQLLATIR